MNYVIQHTPILVKLLYVFFINITNYLFDYFHSQTPVTTTESDISSFYLNPSYKIQGSKTLIDLKRIMTNEEDFNSGEFEEKKTKIKFPKSAIS